MSSEVITAQECRRLLRDAGGVEKALVEQMVSRVQSSIRRSLSQGLTRTSVTVPNFFYGVPEFDRDEVANSVRAIFANNGFHILNSACNAHTFDVIWEEELPPIKKKTTDSSNTSVKRAVAAAVDSAQPTEHKTVKLN